MVGDPVVIASDKAYSIDRLEDFSLSTPNGRFAFHRTYYSSDEPWRAVTASLGAPVGGSRLTNVPKPFGPSRIDRNSLRWTHSLFSFVDVRTSATTDGGAHWVVRPPVGTQEQFKNCSTDCWAAREPGSPGQRNRLFRHSDGGFEYHQADGKRYVYANATSDGGMYFLSQLATDDGRLIAVVNYSTPTPCTSVTSATVPWVSSVELGGGQQLAFTYALKGTPDAGNECVLSSVSTGSGGSATTLASYTYEQNLAGLLSEAQAASFTESFAYDAGFTVFRQGVAVVAHSGALVSSATDPRGSWSFNAAVQGDVYSNGTACSTLPAVEQTTSNAAPRVGDGNDSSAGLIEKYTYMSGRTLTRDTTVPIKRVDSCTAGGYACSAGSVHWVYAGVAGLGTTCSASNPGYLYATKNKRNNWTVTPTRAPDGGVNSSFEVTARWVGVPSDGGSNGPLPNPFPNPGTNGANALEPTEYTYAYQAGAQSVASETRPSALSTDGGMAVTTWVRDSSNRVISQYQSGVTQLIDGTIEPKLVARFWSYGTGGRVETASGPCFVADAGITSCSGDYPLTTYAYFTSGEFNIGKLQSVTRKASSSVNLVTSFANYTALGEPRTVTDENGVVTTLTYSGHNVATRSVALSGGGSVTWSYTWENEKLTAIEFPQLNRETYCYRTVSSASVACSGTWTGRLQRVRKEGSDGSWSEAILYDYWPDGSLKSEVRVDYNGGNPETRFMRTYAADAHERQTLVTTGHSGTFSEPRGYDEADNLVGLGAAFNGAPAYCRESGGAISKLCAQLGYDRAERLRQLDLYTGASSSTPIRACIDYDKRGNVSRVTSGCGSTCSVEAIPTVCGGDEKYSHDYITDDFGNLVEVRLSGTLTPFGMYTGTPADRGRLRMEFDARGNRTKQQSQQQRESGGLYLVYAFDLVDRETSRAQNSTVLATHSYDVAASNDPPGDCPQPIRTVGRVRRIEDPFMTRWFQYDELGRTTREIRLRTGGTSCVDDSMSLTLAYSTNGNLTALTYGFGRQVGYTYGSNALVDRPVSMTAGFYFLNDGGTETRTVVDNVKWEPYGNLRTYRMNFVDAGIVADVDYGMGAASETLANSECNDAVGAVDQTGRLRRVRVSEGSNEIYRRMYKWEADQIRRISSCYLNDTDDPITEDYTQGSGHGYDGLQRLLGGSDPNHATNAGPMEERKYTYNARGVITSAFHFPDAGYFFELSSSPMTADWVEAVTPESGNLEAWNGLRMWHDYDGNLVDMYAPYDSWGMFSARTTLDYNSTTSAAGPSSGSVFRTATIFARAANSYVTYSYWYDSRNRRQAKVHPVNDATEVYLYDLGHQLLESQGFKSTTTAAPYPTDEYLWLGGRPVAMFRATFVLQGDGSIKHKQDDSSLADCGRKGDVGSAAAKCGLYFLVTDHLGKPVLVMDQHRRIAGVGEYEPYGQVNRTQKWWQTPHPVPADAGTSSFTHNMKELGGMKTDMRVHFPLVDTDQECGGTPRDFVTLKASGVDLETIGGNKQGEVWSNWHNVPADAGVVPLAVAWTAAEGACFDWFGTACGVDCPTSSYSSGSGVVMREVEYQRYQAGATPFFPPLRFPGHLWDPETDFYENWHRYYSPFKHGYLSPEPMLQSPTYPWFMAQSGGTAPAYAYARNNPVKNTDPTGLYALGDECPDYAAALKIARRKAGCDGAVSQCRDKILKSGGCDICEILADGEGPLLQPTSIPIYTPEGDEAWGKDDSTYYNGVAVIWKVKIARRFCTGDPETLASLMIHEGMHACKNFSQRKYDPLVELLNQTYCESCFDFYPGYK